MIGSILIRASITADALWTLLRGLVAVASEQCIEAGYPPRPAPAVGFAGEAHP